ncbi:MAG: NADH-quinone oxidoreductase subunit A [Burkholderiales bacterium]
MTPYATLLLFIAAAVGLVGLIVGLNALLGPRPVAPVPDKLDPFECGAVPLQRANVRPLSVKYYPIAIFFLLFDVETVLLFIWASATGDPEIATLSLVSFLVFMALLGFAFAYLWTDGGLEWR